MQQNEIYVYAGWEAEKKRMAPAFELAEQAALTRREQEIPHLYRWWDELR